MRGGAEVEKRGNLDIFRRSWKATLFPANGEGTVPTLLTRKPITLISGEMLIRTLIEIALAFLQEYKYVGFLRDFCADLEHYAISDSETM